MYVLDDYGDVILGVDAVTGEIYLVAGNGTDHNDGIPATSAQLLFPQGIVVSADGATLYIADTYNCVVRSVDISRPNGTISLFAGSYVCGYGGDGAPASSASAMLRYPFGLTIGLDGAVYIADTGNSIVRVVTPDGILLTLAGAPEMSGYSGDGDIALNATLDSPQGVLLDANGDLYVTDTFNCRVRVVGAGAAPHYSTSATPTASASPGYSPSGTATATSSATVMTAVSVTATASTTRSPSLSAAQSPRGSGGENALPVAAIAGGSVAGVVALIAVGAFAFFCWRRQLSANDSTAAAKSDRESLGSSRAAALASSAVRTPVVVANPLAGTASTSPRKTITFAPSYTTGDTNESVPTGASTRPPIGQQDEGAAEWQ